MSENLNRGSRDFSKYDTMETAELEEILRLDAALPEGAESDTELLLYVMGVLADRRRNNGVAGKTAFEAWESFEKNYMPGEEECEEPSEIPPHHLWSNQHSPGNTEEKLPDRSASDYHNDS